MFSKFAREVTTQTHQEAEVGVGLIPGFVQGRGDILEPEMRVQAASRGQAQQTRQCQVVAVAAMLLACASMVALAVITPSLRTAVDATSSLDTVVLDHESTFDRQSGLLGYQMEGFGALLSTTTSTTEDYNFKHSVVVQLPYVAQRPQSFFWPSLFCWCIMQSVGAHTKFGWSEETLIRIQMERGIGIFDCNEYAVMTDEPLILNRWGPVGFPPLKNRLPPPNDTFVVSWGIGSTEAPSGAESNPLNTMAFRVAWDAIRGSRRLDHHDWVVKVDPDAVWFPDRLRSHLKTYMPGHGNGWDNLYLQNCLRWGTMQGPIEVISKKAAITLENQIMQCGGFWGTGEDQFLVHCMGQLGVPAMMEGTLLNDKYCDGFVDCHNDWKVAFHPHKNPERFMECYNVSARAAAAKMQ